MNRQYYRKSIVFILLLILGVVTRNATGMSVLAAPAAKAQTATSSSDTTTQKLRERIEKVVEEKKDQVKNTLEELTGKRRGLVGEVQRVSSEAITIKTNKTTQIIPIASELPLLKKGKRISLDDVAVGDWAIVVGSLKDDTFVPSRVIISAASLRPKTQIVILGTIKTIGKNDITIVSRNESKEQVFTLKKATSYQDNQGNPITLKDLEKDLQVLVIGSESENKLEAEVIRTLGSF